MKLLFLTILVFCAAELYAAPVGTGHYLSPAEMRQRVINAAGRYKNTPYLFGGMTSRGLDCSGFIVLSFKDALGISLPRTAAAMYAWTERITLDIAQPGDLLFFRTGNFGNITHVALYLGNGRFIHSASAGPRTGVIYSSLNEPYWARTYAGAGRVLPAVAPGTGNTVSAVPDRQRNTQGRSSLQLGIGIAPTWNFVFTDGLFRGFTSHLHLGTYTEIRDLWITFGMELRPEYDRRLEVFRLPATLSLGFNNKFSIFAGPVLSIGNPTFFVGEEEHSFLGGTSWFGAAGLMFTPVNQQTRIGSFAPFMEISWQYYLRSAGEFSFADFRTMTRFSTGVRWAMNVRQVSVRS